MKKEQKEIKVTVNGEIDLREMPQKIFNLFIAALQEEIEWQVNSDDKSI